jgi:protein farnesyltransferase subunit beta
MVETLDHCWGGYSTSQHPVSKEEDPFYFIGTDEPGNVTLLVGGFGGGPSQMPHAATTFASVCSLCILVTSGGKAAVMAKDLIARIRMPLYRWMATLLTPASGAYRMHTDGEIDVRATYTILSCAKLLGIASPFLCQESVSDFIRSCQTFEGGLGGEPWSEAHGGYTYCGVAALHILGKLEVLDIPALTGWVARRQMVFEGGFSGRSNKLVDGCYSFWQGGEIS